MEYGEVWMFEVFDKDRGGHLLIMGGSRRLKKGLGESSIAQECAQVSWKTSW